MEKIAWHDKRSLADLRRKVIEENRGKVLPDVVGSLERAGRLVDDLDSLKALLIEAFEDIVHYFADGRFALSRNLVTVCVESSAGLLPEVEAEYVRESHLGEKHDPIPVTFELHTYSKTEGATYSVSVPEPDDRPPLRARDVMRV